MTNEIAGVITTEIDLAFLKKIRQDILIKNHQRLFIDERSLMHSQLMKD